MRFRAAGLGILSIFPGIALCLAMLSAAARAQESPSVLQLVTPEGPALYKRLSLEELMHIEVTSVSKRPERLSETASSIQVITAEEIRRSGATTLPEVLRLANNLQVAQQNSHQWAISARGFNTALANKLLVLMDGRSVYTPLFSGVYWDQQDYLLEDIERIEVISGPGGALWGANAVNGVINILTKPAADTQGLYAEAGGGSQPRGFGGVRFGGALSATAHYRIFAKAFDMDDELLSNGDSSSDSWRMAQSGFRVDAAPRPDDGLTVQGHFYAGDEEIPTGNESRVEGANLLGRWTRALAGDSDLALQIYFDRSAIDQAVPRFFTGGVEFAPAGILRHDLDTYDLDFQHRLRWGPRQELVWGLGYRLTRNTVENAPALGFFPTHLQQELWSGFLQDAVRLREDLVFTIGTKVEHNDYTGVELEPSLRLQWAATQKQNLWAAVSRAVRTPSRVDRDLSQPAPPHFVLLTGGDEFQSETVVAYEAGHRAQVGERLATSLALFYNEYDDIRSLSTDPETLFPLFFENNVEGETWGAELTASFEVDERWHLQGGYTFLRQSLRVAPGKFDLNAALNETADPRHQLSLRTSVDLPHAVGLDAALRWVDELRVNDGPTIAIVPSYAELDLSIRWRSANGLELSIVGRNLLHDRHLEYGFPSATRGEISRAVYGKVAWSF